MISINGTKVEFGQFPNGETYIQRQTISNPAHEYNEVTLRYEGDEDLFRLLLVREQFDTAPILHITYVPYSRMDRASKEYCFSLKTFTSFINNMYWKKVYIYEPHSDVSSALLDRVKVRNVVWPHLISWVHNPDYQLFFPDAGAQKRYESIPHTLDTLVGFKHRDFKTGKILSLEILGERKSDNVVIVDDLCSKGGTFVLAAEKLREMGFTQVILIVAHCEDTIFTGKVFDSKLIDHVITTDSIVQVEDFNKNMHIKPLGDIW